MLQFWTLKKLNKVRPVQKSKKIITDLFEAEVLQELANVSLEDSGLPYIIWFYDTSYNKLKHNLIRGKLTTLSGQYPISIEDPIEFIDSWPKEVYAKEFKKIKEFIKLNRAAIVKYWHGSKNGYLTKDFINSIKYL